MLKNKLLKLGIFSLAISGASLAQAEGLYLGGNYASIDYSEDYIDDEPTLGAIYGRFGTFFTENFSLEGRLGVGMSGDTVGDFGFDVDVDLETMYSIIGRAGIEAGDVFYPYVALGYTRGEIEYSVSGFGSDSSAESDVSFGLGADFRINDGFNINVEYMNYFDKDGVELSGLAVGVAFAL